MSEIMNLTNENFETEVLASEKNVLVDFWAEWCGPCKKMTPVLEQIAVEKADKIKVCKLNVDEYSDIASSFQIMSLPTVLFFSRGEVVSQEIGLKSKNVLLDIIDSL